ncbi:LamG-like jellyroll fold domain-containing protein [Nocardia sp. CA-120079]|uniref:LamG-like jellyroll fold domain-containing protein n=1 Tax=Nocardia sp. CA-120079 TaxID=3239974 RepID=UPI003D97C88B
MTHYPAAVDRMAGTLTTPFAAGADHVDLVFASGEPSRDASFEEYDFREHLARFGTDPRTRYIVAMRQDLADDISMTVRYQARGSGRTSVTFVIAAGTPAGTSVLVPLGSDAVTAVLKSVSVRAPQGAPDLRVQAAFRFTALLGDLAALLWVLGGERDHLGAHLNRVRTQHTAEHAVGLSLDLIGSDLSIPRFPPRPYGFSPNTIALYHLEDKADTATVADAMALYTGAGHPGTRSNATPRVDGRFGFGMGFRYGQSEITVADHADFALPATASFTAECFLRPASGDWQGAVLSKHTNMIEQAKPGWGLHIGHFRGLDRNLRLLLSDGTTKVELAADVSLGTDRFHHVAAVLDRDRGVARLFVDGALVASTVTNIGALTNSSPLRIGFADLTGGGFSSGFYGTVDEVRISRGPIVSFAPVLGEDDESYRRRLTLFRRWNLPTPTDIADALNEIVGKINDVANPITVSDSFVRTPVGTHTVTIRPAALRPGESIDARGRRQTTEVEVCGTVAEDLFDPQWLVRFDSPTVAFPAGDRRMRITTLRHFEALLDLLGYEINQRLSVTAGYDPAATDLRATGRALVLRHPTEPAGRIAALAHKAGFDWVRYRAASGDVYVSVADTSVMTIRGSGYWFGKDLGVGNPATDLSIYPEPPADSTFRWSLLESGPGRAEFVGSTTDAHSAVRALQPGEVTVKLEVRRGGKGFSTTRRFTIGPQGLNAGTSIGADGTLGVAESVAGTAEDGAYSPNDLVTVTDPLLRVEVPGSNRMQADVAVRLGRLLVSGALNTYDRPQQVRIVSGWQPNGTGLDRVGRALTLAPADPALSLAALGRNAHSAGFDYVLNTGTVIRVAQRAGEHLAVTGSSEVDEGDSVSIALPCHESPVGAVLAGTVLCTANKGSSTVSFLDSTTGTLIGSTKVGDSPVAIAAGPDGKTVYTASSTERTVTAITVATMAVAATMSALPETPLAVACHPAKAQLLVLVPTKVVVVDATTMTIVDQWPVPDGSIAKLLALNPTGAIAWVACADKTLRAVDIGTGAWVQAPTLPGIPRALAVSRTNVYVTTSAEQKLWVLDATTRTVTGTFDDIDLIPSRLHVDETAGVVYLGAWYSKYVQRRTLSGVAEYGNSVEVPGVPIAIVPAGAAVLTVVQGEIGLGQSDAVAVLRPDLWRSVTALWPFASAAAIPPDRPLSWSVRPFDQAAAHLDGSTGGLAKLTADGAGTVQVRVRAKAIGNPPYTVQIGLDQSLLDGESTGTPVVIRRDQYERIMNVINELHPIGVEFETRVIREHVLELKAGQLEIFPAYTYPTYRLRGQQFARPTRKD